MKRTAALADTSLGLRRWRNGEDARHCRILYKTMSVDFHDKEHSSRTSEIGPRWNAIIRGLTDGP